MLAYMDFFLGGDEKRIDLPPRLHERFPMSLPFGGDGSYMAPFTLHNDNILTSLMSQVCLSILRNSILCTDALRHVPYFLFQFSEFNYMHTFNVVCSQCNLQPGTDWLLG